MYIDILGDFIKIQRRIEYVLVTTDHFIIITKTVPMKDISAAEMDRHFVKPWYASRTHNKQQSFLQVQVIYPCMQDNVDSEKNHNNILYKKERKSKEVKHDGLSCVSNVCHRPLTWMGVVHQFVKIRVQLPSEHIRRCGTVQDRDLGGTDTFRNKTYSFTWRAAKRPKA